MKRSNYAMVLALALTVGAPASAPAEKAVAQGDKTVGLQAALEGLHWGAAVNEVLGHFEKVLWGEYKDRKKSLPGPLEIDRLREQTQRRVLKLKQRLSRFDRASTDYRVSIIDRDFKRGTNEAVLRVDADDAQRYWFFVSGQLWKLVVAFNADAVAGQDIPSFARKLRKLYGKPVDREFEQSGGHDVVVAVKWADESTELVLRDRLDPYGTFTLTFASRDLGGRISELRGEVAALATGEDGENPDQSALIDDIMTAPDEEAEADVVDELIGGKPDAKPAPLLPDAEEGGAQPGAEDGDEPLIY